MEVFLPIAQVLVNPVEILLLSAIVGVLSGLFGVGGGFLMTPFLIFMGVLRKIFQHKCCLELMK